MKINLAAPQISWRAPKDARASQNCLQQQQAYRVHAGKKVPSDRILCDTVIGGTIGAGAGLLAATSGGWVGGVGGAVAGGLSGLVLGTVGAANLDLPNQSFKTGLATGVAGTILGYHIGYNGNTAAGIALTVGGGCCGALMGVMWAWDKD